MGNVGIVLILIYTIALLVIANKGIRGGKADSGSTRKYFLGGGNGTLVLVFSIVASGGSAWLFQGGPASVYANGISWLTLCVIWSMTYYVMYGYLGPRGYALSKTHGFVTTGEMYERFYGNHVLPVFVGVLQVLALIPTTIAQMKGMGLAIELLTDGKIPHVAGVFFAALVIVLYCTAGGFGSLSLVDTVQGIMFTAIIWFGLITLFAVSGGSLSGIFSAIAEKNPRALLYATEKDAYWTFWMALSYCVVQSIGNLAHPVQWQRFFSAKSGKHLKKMATFLAPVYGIVVLAATLTVGLFINAFDLSTTTPENAFQTLMGNINPVFGLIVGMGIIAAAMSTAAGSLFSASSIGTMNILRSLKPDMEDKKLQRVGKILIVLFALFCSWQALSTGTSITLLMALGLSLLAGAVLPLSGLFFWKRATAAGSIAGIIALLGSMVYFNWFNPNFLGIYAGCWALGCGVAVFVVVSLFTEPVSDEQRERFLAPIRRER